MVDEVPSRLSRRQWGVAAMSGVLSTLLHADNTSSPPPHGWIDAHVHVWTPDVKKYSLEEGFTTQSMQPRSFTPEELFTHTKPAGVSRVVLIQMSYYGFDNSYMLDVIAKHPQTFVGVAIVDHHATDLPRTVKELAAQGVRGFRVHPKADEAKTWTRDEGMLSLWRLAQENNLAICPLINPNDLPHVDLLCERMPGVRVVIDHFARIGIDGVIRTEQLKALCSMARHPRLHVKTSAFYALGKKKAPYDDLAPMIRQLVDSFGTERLMWASDCPFQVEGGHTYADSIALIRDRIDSLSSSEKSMILRDTAHQFFFSTDRA